MSYEVIEHIEVGSGGQASITFSSIPADYTDLFLTISARSGRSNVNEAIRLSFNGSTTGFSDRFLEGTGSSATSGTGSRYAGQAVATTGTSNTFGNVEIYIPNYAGSANKSYSVNSVTENNATFAVQDIIAGLWSNTDAISSITLTTDFANNFLEYTSATLYGIRKYDTAGSPKATGGIISFDSANNKWVHTFTASGTFTPTENITCEYLVVAGGGSGGSQAGGGGGAGGYRSSVSGESSGGGASAETPLSLTASTGYTVTVGAGGAGVSGSEALGNSGNNSVFATITSDGGGGGGHNESNGVSGGSGSGGGGRNNRSGGSGTANQGYDGADSLDGTTSGTGRGGGGGGAGSAGVSGDSVPDGGSGVSSSITGTPVGRAGGGGGGAQSPSPAGSASDGGGAGGLTTGVAKNGTINTGGGGGGNGTSVNYSGSGGSGIVIVRYNA